MTLTLISILIFALYIGVIISAYGVPASVSETFYLLPKKANWLFTAFCWGVSIIVAPWLDATPEPWQFLAFLSVGGLCFVGTATQFKEQFVARVHFAGAGVCAVASQLWVLLIADMWWVSVICLFIAGGLCLGLWSLAKTPRPTNITFWVEMWAFVSLFISLFWQIKNNQYLCQ